jgi:single-strand DNA-binding protein
MARKQTIEADVTEADVDGAATAKSRSYGLNRFTLLGRMTADPQMRFTQTGKAVLYFGLATSVNGFVEFHDLVAWEHTAEILAKYGAKGRELFVEGRISSRPRDVEGHRIKQVQLVVENFQLLGAPVTGRSGSEDAASEGAA